MPALLSLALLLFGCNPQLVDGGPDGGSGGGASTAAGGAGGGGANAFTDAGFAGHDAGCAPEEERPEWRWRVLLILDWSQLMCVVDPPGSTSSSAQCETVVPQILGQFPGVVVAGRVKAAEQFIERHRATNDGGITVDKAWGAARPFDQDPNSARVELRILQTQLEPWHDYQTSLTRARETIELDLRRMSERARSRTRYMVILLGSGLPAPRCSPSDALTLFASGSRPELVWADTNDALCNDPLYGQNFVDRPAGLSPGGAWNQNDELLGLASDLVAVGRFYGAASVELHTRLTVSERAIAACGSACDPFWPGGVRGSQVRQAGAWLLQRLAERGGGTFADPGEPQSLSLLDLASKPVQTFCVD